jgi:hypothetical protein
MLNNHIRRDTDLYGREVPDGMNAGFHHEVCKFLGNIGWNRENTDLYAHPLYHAGKFVHVEDLLTANFPANLCFVGIKTCDDIHTIFPEALIVKEG